jgi:hypothetical protein
VPIDGITTSVHTTSAITNEKTQLGWQPLNTN